jgi:subtilisin family serine protease
MVIRLLDSMTRGFALLLIVSGTALAQPKVIVGKELVLVRAVGALSSVKSHAPAYEVRSLSGSAVQVAEVLSADRFTEALNECAHIEALDPEVLCEPNVQFSISATPSDPYWPWMEGLRAISAPSAWDESTSSTGVSVAVVDTGVDYRHPDLAANIALNHQEIPGNGIDDDHNGYIDDFHGFSTVSKAQDPLDLNGHGTHVAGTVGAVGNNKQGVTGVAWSARIVPVQVLDQHGSGSLVDVVRGIDYAVARKVGVINLSLGAPFGSKLLLQALQRAEAAGILIVAAAGNDGRSNDEYPSFPANYQLGNLISVAASGVDDALTSFSNYGKKMVHLAAPGEKILSTYPGRSYVFMSGTSMAAPHVAGAAALLLSELAEPASQRVKDALLNSVDLIPSYGGKILSGGRLNLARALVALHEVNESPDDSETPGEESETPIGVELSAKYAKDGKRAQVRAQAYSLSDGSPAAGLSGVLSCGSRIRVTAKTNTRGIALFRVNRDKKTVVCSVQIDSGRTTYSNSMVLRSVSRGR